MVKTKTQRVSYYYCEICNEEVNYGYDHPSRDSEYDFCSKHKEWWSILSSIEEQGDKELAKLVLERIRT